MRAILFMCLFFFLATASLAADCGRILTMSGTVEVLRTPTKSTVEASPPRVAFPISANDVIRCDDIIVTGERSSAVLIIPRGKLAIGANTKITIAKYANEKKPDANLIDLFFGQLRSLITKKKPSSDSDTPQKFQVRTPTAVTGVRGTDFFVAYDEKTKVTEQATLEGEVEVTPNGAAATADPVAPVVVRAGQQVSVGDKAMAVEVAPISDNVKTKIRATSTLIQKDADFVGVESSLTKEDKKEVAERLAATRWIFAFGPSGGEVKHSSGSVGGSGISGESLVIERQKPKKTRSLLMGLNLLEAEEGSFNAPNSRSRLSVLSFESGLRIWHTNKWSPYIKAGLGYLRNDAEVFGTSNKFEYVALVGAVGIDAIFKPFNWQSVGIYTAADGRLNQTLFEIGKDNPSNLEDGSLNAFFVTLKAGISAEF